MMWTYLCIFLSIVVVAILATDDHFSPSNFFTRCHDHSVAQGTVGEPEPVLVQPEVMEGHGEPEKNFRLRTYPVYPMNQPPPSRTSRSITGAYVPRYVCGWALRWDWLVENTPDRPKRGDLQFHAMQALLFRIQSQGGEFMRSTVDDEEGYYCPCILIATNETELDIDRIHNEDNISRVQSAIGLDEEPKWYRVTSG